MDPEGRNARLSKIETVWGIVSQAHAGPAGGASAAQQELLEQYSGAIYRYLLGAVRNPDIADDLIQEFSLRFLRGDFRAADPQRGRFRDFIKTALFHLIVDHQRRQQAHPQPLTEQSAEPPTDRAHDAELAFRNSWRDELMHRTWSALAELERSTGQPCHTVLRLRAADPTLSSRQMTEQLAVQVGKPFTIHGARQALHRAREKFSDLLVHEVARTLEDRSQTELEQELIDLELLEYCRPALARRGRS